MVGISDKIGSSMVGTDLVLISFAHGTLMGSCPMVFPADVVDSGP